MAMMPRDRVEAALRGLRPDRVPFTVYDSQIPRGEVERELRNEGVCLVARRPSVFRAVSPNVTRRRVAYREDGAEYVRTEIRTPAGDLSSLERTSPGGESSWLVEPPFKGPEDYRKLEAMVRDEGYLPDYEVVEAAQRNLGGDGFLLTNIGDPPLQVLMDTLMGLEAFSREWNERRDEVIRLHDAIAENRRRLYPVVAESPVLAANYGANVSAEVVGLERFERHFLPHYEEFADAMHARGKLVGVHFDANTWLLSEAIGRSGIDFVEALTPRPDTDMSVAEARCAWPNKVLWVNFPTSIHAEAPEVIAGAARQILFEAAPGDRFLLGISEQIPSDRWSESLGAILRVIRERGSLPMR